MDALTVFWFALATAVATGLGAVPFVVVRRARRAWLGVSNAVAAGLMLAASYRLLEEGALHGAWRLGLGAGLGFLFIVGSQRTMRGRDDVLRMGRLRGADAVKGLLIVGIMTLHSLTEGIGVGVSFGGGVELGIFITVAIALHNIPEGLAISLVLVPRGEPVWRAAWWSVFSSFPQPLLAVPAFLCVEAFRPVLPVGLGFAGGAMVWMVLSELLPDSLRDTSKRAAAAAVVLSAAAMLAFQALLRG